jgi:hypothetical protein
MPDLPEPGDAIAVAGHAYAVLHVDPFPDGMRLTLEYLNAAEVVTTGNYIPGLCGTDHPDLPYLSCSRDAGHDGVHVGRHAGSISSWAPGGDTLA